MSKPLAIFLMGPTASGKSALAMELVQRLPCDIISVDSALVYRGMDIGTAKPTAAELAVAPHRLIDLLDPTQAYSAADFCHDALREMAAITAASQPSPKNSLGRPMHSPVSGRSPAGADKSGDVRRVEEELSDLLTAQVEVRVKKRARGAQDRKSVV